MLADPLQDIDQVVIGIDVVEAASGQQTLHDTDLFGTQFRPAEQPSLPALEMVKRKAILKAWDM